MLGKFKGKNITTKSFSCLKTRSAFTYFSRGEFVRTCPDRPRKYLAIHSSFLVYGTGSKIFIT